MGVVADFVDGIESAVKDFLNDAVSSTLSTTFDLLKGGLDTSKTDGIGGMFQQFLSVHPANFTGGGTGTTSTIWSTIETVCNNAIVPVAGMVFAIVVINDLVQMVISGNNFKDFDDSIFIKWILKVVCGVLLISNVYYIASGFFAFGTQATGDAMTALLGTTTYTGNITVSNSYGIGMLIVLLLLSLIILVGVFVMLAVIVVVLASRMIEIFMYLGISPLPMATMMNNVWSEVGKNWFRGLVALAFQGVFIIFALGIFSTMFTNALVKISSGSGGDAIMQMAMLLGYTLALIFTILRSGAISKSIFNAH